MTQPIAKRPDEIVVGDRILHQFLPAPFAEVPGEVVFVRQYTAKFEQYVFVAYWQDGHGYDSTTYLVAGKTLEVIPADTGLGYSRGDDDPEITQPIAGRVPAHYGALVNEGGHTAVAVGGGLIEIDPPEGFVPASTAKVRYDSTDVATCSVCGESVQQFLWDSHAYQHTGEVVWPVANSEQP